MPNSSQSPEKSTEVSQKRSNKSSRRGRQKPHPRSALTLKETLSECREDIIKLKDPEIIKSTLKQLNEYNDVAIPMPSDYDLLQQPFERVSTENTAGNSGNKIRSIFSISSRAARMKKKQTQRLGLASSHHPHPPPPWKIPEVIHGRLSLIQICIIIHEIACYLSAVLAGLLIWHAFEGISWTSKEISLTYSWVYNWLYQPISTFSVVITSLGFLSRVELNSSRNFRKFLIFLVPTVILLGSFYAKKGLDLTDLELYNQKMESERNFNQTGDAMDKITNNYDDNSINSKFLTLILVSSSALMAVIISFYLHLHRHSFYLVRNYQNEYEANES